MTVHFHDIAEQIEVSASGGETAGKRNRIYDSGLKRAFDLTLIILSLPLSLFVVLLFAGLIALDGHNPFYRQDRVGRNGRIFRIWKLRSMVPNADAKLAEYLSENADARAEWETSQKLKNDPRITAIGRLIRRTSVDELPQLLNVLMGDMSLVGPRPMMVSQTSMYPGSAYFRLRPGMTGFWQISDRNECTFGERATFDAKYYDQMSLKTDVSIIASTFGVVLRCTGY